MTLILNENFRNGINTDIWCLYSSVGYNPYSDSYFQARNLVTDSTGLHLNIKREIAPDGIRRYTGSGLETCTTGINRITKGRCEVRARFPQGNQGIVGYILLWPANHIWPPEIDFAETSGNDSNVIGFYQHYGIGNTVLGNSYNLDITQYHVYIVDVDTDAMQLKWYIDGVLIATQPIHFSIPQEWIVAAGIWACCYDNSALCPGVTDNYCGNPANTNFPQSLDIDYVKLYDSIPVPPIMTCSFNYIQ
jgi:hypothetical protein